MNPQTEFQAKSSNLLNVNNIKLSRMRRDGEDLADYVRRKREEHDPPLSLKDVERRSRAGGGKGVSSGYVSQIENRHVLNVTPDKLRYLALGLGGPYAEIHAIASKLETTDVDSLEHSIYAALHAKEKKLTKPEHRQAAARLTRMVDTEFDRMIAEE